VLGRAQQRVDERRPHNGREAGAEPRVRPLYSCSLSAACLRPGRRRARGDAPLLASLRMWTEVFDDDAPAVVWLFSGTTNVDADFDGWLASMARIDRATAGRRAVGIVVIDDGNPPPGPAHRERLTATARSMRGGAPLAVVTSSAIARGVIAGLNLAGVVDFALKGFSSVDEAVVWLVQRRPTHTTVHLHSLVEEARAQTKRRATAVR
jgi:hypothetical protein